MLKNLIRQYSTKLKLPNKELTLKKFEFPRSSCQIKELSEKNFKHGENVVLNGWIDKKPKKMSKELVFGKLRDSNGDIIQIVDQTGKNILKGLQSESAISVQGRIAEKNEKSKEIFVENIQVLNKAGLIGSQLTSGDTKQWPAEHRYLQLRSPATNLQNNLKKRAKIVQSCRKVLDDLDFTEIETPLLFKSTPEGAREFLVPTRRKGYMYALPQSPQQYKQLLMASGVHKYYQIAKCFRDEDLRQDRQYEFTQLDMEMSFANGGDVRRVIEQLVRRVFYDVGGRLVNPDGSEIEGREKKNFVSMSYQQAISKYGIDKPDLRYSNIEIENISDAVESPNSEFPVVEALRIEKTNCDMSQLMDKKEYKHRMPIFIQDGDFQILEQAGYKISNLSKLNALVDDNNIIAISNRQNTSYENPTPLGRLRQLYCNIGSYTGVSISSGEFVVAWIKDFPLFNPEERSSGKGSEYPAYDYTKYVSTHHPFTMAHPEDYTFLETDPLKVRGQHYDLVINGVEVGGGSTRIHDVTLQQYIFNLLGVNENDGQKLFGHLLRAFDSGCPPHAGLALGLDRMVAMLCGTESIRDVIAFPKTITGADPMIGCPSRVTGEQLGEYFVVIKK